MVSDVGKCLQNKVNEEKQASEVYRRRNRDTQPERCTLNVKSFSMTHWNLEQFILTLQFFFHFPYKEHVLFVTCTRQQDACFKVNEKTGQWRFSNVPLPVPPTLCEQPWPWGHDEGRRGTARPEASALPQLVQGPQQPPAPLCPGVTCPATAQEARSAMHRADRWPTICTTHQYSHCWSWQKPSGALTAGPERRGAAFTRSQHLPFSDRQVEAWQTSTCPSRRPDGH